MQNEWTDDGEHNAYAAQGSYLHFINNAYCFKVSQSQNQFNAIATFFLAIWGFKFNKCIH